jgi:hypothetical protein
MSKFGYKLVCTNGETEGDEVILVKKQLPTVAKFLRAELNWSLASAANTIDHTPEQPVCFDYFEAMGLMMDKGIFQNKYQARSSWHLAEAD